MDHVAVFGIGSTNCRYTVARSDGAFLTEATVEPTAPRDLPAQLVAAIDELQAATSHALDAVAISCTGLVDAPAGVIRDLDTPTGETIERVDIVSRINEAHGLPVSLANDCNAAALGEWKYGARADHDCLAHVTFGTGIGGGIVEQGRLVRGDSGQAGEFGLLPVAPHDQTSTGVAGAWEAVCSGRGIPQYVAQRAATGDESGNGGDTDNRVQFADSETYTAEAVFEAAATGDGFAAACLDEIARYNAAGIATICNAVNPSLITLGGGVALNNPDWIVSGIERYLDQYLFVARPEVILSPLGDDIGLYGALATVRDESSAAEEEAGSPQAPRGQTD